MKGSSATFSTSAAVCILSTILVFTCQAASERFIPLYTNQVLYTNTSVRSIDCTADPRSSCQEACTSLCGANGLYPHPYDIDSLDLPCLSSLPPGCLVRIRGQTDQVTYTQRCLKNNLLLPDRVRQLATRWHTNMLDWHGRGSTSSLSRSQFNGMGSVIHRSN